MSTLEAQSATGAPTVAPHGEESGPAVMEAIVQQHAQADEHGRLLGLAPAGLDAIEGWLRSLPASGRAAGIQAAMLLGDRLLQAGARPEAVLVWERVTRALSEALTAGPGGILATAGHEASSLLLTPGNLLGDLLDP